MLTKGKRKPDHYRYCRRVDAAASCGPNLHCCRNFNCYKIRVPFMLWNSAIVTRIFWRLVRVWVWWTMQCEMKSCFLFSLRRGYTATFRVGWLATETSGIQDFVYWWSLKSCCPHYREVTVDVVVADTYQCNYGIKTVMPVMLQEITAASIYSLALNAILNEHILFYKVHCQA